MGLIRTVVITLGGLGVLGVGGFFALGQYSQGGQAQGLVNGTLAPCPDTPNCVSSETDTVADKRVEPFEPEVWDALPAAIADLGGKVTRLEPDYIAAEFTSATFGFVDDLELRRTEASVEVRSASRVGYSDRGVNAARVAELRQRLAGG